jgi:hypothetical protein
LKEYLAKTTTAIFVYTPLKEALSPNEQITDLPTPTGPADETDDHSQDTIPHDRAPDINEEELVEIYLSCEITTNNNNECGPHLCHAAVLNAMYNLFPEEKLQLINNQNQQIKPRNYQKWSKQEYYKKHFDIHILEGRRGRPNRHYVVHRIRTTLLLSTIRHDQKIFQALQDSATLFSGGCMEHRQSRILTIPRPI